jgi:hypothetical protein
MIPLATPASRGIMAMTSVELRDTLRQQPFQPFRLFVSDGASYDVRHPDLLWVGQFTCYVGLTGSPGQTFFERSVKIDVDHITRIEPLEAFKAAPKNGPV